MRLQRVGRRHEPSFRLVLTDSKNSTKSGRISETLGSYDPRKITESFNTERIKHWLSQGIGLTPSVNNLLIKHRIISGKKIHVSTVSTPTPVVDEVPVAEEAPAAPSSIEAQPEAEPVSEEKPAPESKEEVADEPPAPVV